MRCLWNSSRRTTPCCCAGSTETPQPTDGYHDSNQNHARGALRLWDRPCPNIHSYFPAAICRKRTSRNLRDKIEIRGNRFDFTVVDKTLSPPVVNAMSEMFQFSLFFEPTEFSPDTFESIIEILRSHEMEVRSDVNSGNDLTNRTSLLQYIKDGLLESNSIEFIVEYNNGFFFFEIVPGGLGSEDFREPYRGMGHVTFHFGKDYVDCTSSSTLKATISDLVPVVEDLTKLIDAKFGISSLSL